MNIENLEAVIANPS